MTFLREVGRDGGSPAKRSWVPAEPHFSKFGPPGGQTLADLLRPQTHDLFAEGWPGRTLADLLRLQTHDLSFSPSLYHIMTFLRRAGREAWTL